MVEMTKAEKYQMVGGGVSAAVYAAVAWVGARLLEVTFWRAFGVLIVLRAFFGFVEMFAGILNWRIFAKRRTVAGFVEVLRANNFPPRFYQSDDFLSYLARIETDQKLAEQVKRAAKEFHQVLAFFESQGILVGARMHSASELALEAYSPKARAPVFQLPG